MKEVAIKVYNINELKELNKGAYDRILEERVDTLSEHVLEDTVLFAKNEVFCCLEDHDLAFQWQLYGQGSGVNVYGEFNTTELKTLLKAELSEAEVRTLEVLEKEHLLTNYIKLPYNQRYGYCKADSLDLWDIVDDAFDEWDQYFNYVTDVLRIVKKLIDFIENVCRSLFKELNHTFDELPLIAHESLEMDEGYYTIDGVYISN